MMFLNDNAIGLDIDDRSIELVALKKQGNRAKLLSFSRQALPRGIVVNGLVVNPEQLKIFLDKACQQAKPNAIVLKKVAFSLPANQCYHLVDSLPLLETEINNQAIRQLVAKNFPLPPAELVFDYKIIQAEPKSTLVFVAAASRQVLTAWRDFFAGLHITFDLIDSEIFALARNLVLLDPKQPICLVDIGSVQTNIAIVQSDSIYYDSSVALGGHWFTKAIAESFKLKLVTAERKKMQLGLNSQIFPVLNQQLTTIAEEIKTAIDYYQEHYGGAVKEVILVGGASRLRGLSEFLKDNLSLPTSLGKVKFMTDKMPLEYYGAIGLAWRSLNQKKFQTEPNFNELLTHTPVTKHSIQPIITPNQTNLKTKTIKATPMPIDKTINSVVDNSLADDSADDSNDESLAGKGDDLLAKKLANQKKLLLLILLVGFLLLPLAFWYRQQEQAKQAERNNRYLSASYSHAQNLVLTIPIMIDSVSNEPTAVKARIVESTISVGRKYNEALPDALAQAKGKLVKGEILWPTPLNEIVNQETLTEPLVLRWLAYSQATVLKASLAQLDAINQSKIDYSFSSLEVIDLAKTDQLNLLNFKVRLSINANQEIVVPSADQAVSNPQATTTNPGANPSDASSTSSGLAPTGIATSTAQVIIKKTETGWLNIREGPGPSFSIIQKIDEGGTYEFLEESNGWTKIKLPDGRVGWGAARYIQRM